jgi:hypothetical protein
VSNPNPPISGHHLLWEGSRQPIWSNNSWEDEVTGFQGGCECGCQPLDFPNLSRNKIKAWHRAHKEELRSQGIGVTKADVVAMLTGERVDRVALMHQVLDAAEDALRAGDTERLTKVIFVWSQRREYLLAGEETWEDQHV